MSEKSSGRVGRWIERGRDDFFEERKEVDDWANGRGAMPLFFITIALIVFFTLSIFRVPL